MPHKFSGTWRYFEISGLTATTPSQRDDMVLDIADNGKVEEDKSSQGDFNRVDGTAGDKTLELVGVDDGHGVTRRLHGKAVFEKTINGELHAVIVGRYTNDPSVDPTAAAQNEGTWVISKP